MITIQLQNNKCKITGDRVETLKLINSLKFRHPNAFFIRQYMPKGWDGMFYPITEYGYFYAGLFRLVENKIKELGYKYSVVDIRQGVDTNPKVPKKIGKYILRDYQYLAVKSIIEQKIKGDISLPIGVLKMATNAGKTLMMSAIWKSFKNTKAIMLINDGDLYNQFLKEIPDIIGKENMGYIRAKEAKWGNFTIAMVQTLSRDINKYKHNLSQYDIVLVDEADLSDNKSYKNIIKNCYNAFCRVGLSGTIYMSTLAKDRLKNINLESFLGPEVYNLSKREMMDMGYSTELVIKICEGNNKDIKAFLSYPEAYEKLITKNMDRHEKCIDRIIFNYGYKRLPMMVVCQFKKHTEILFKIIKDRFPELRVEYAHSGINDKIRSSILEDFRVGKVDILVTSYIVKRGKNYPLIRYILNASGSDSNSTISQLMGRGERTHESKSKVYMDDMFDKGKYLLRHSKHRVNYYKKEKVKVILLNNYGKQRKRNKRV